MDKSQSWNVPSSNVFHCETLHIDTPAIMINFLNDTFALVLLGCCLFTIVLLVLTVAMSPKRDDQNDNIPMDPDSR